jgi:peptide/nickel transport system ATP-binding protein/oligopeptide transport system ATP-binding protein
MLFISHDIGMVQWISDEIAVMWRGEIVDRCEPTGLSSPARHDYTKLLLASRLEDPTSPGTAAK